MVEFTYAYLQIIMHRKDVVFPIEMQQIYVYYSYPQAIGWKIGRSIVKAEQAENTAYDCKARI